MKRSITLVVLDGWGIGRRDESNPIHLVKPANFKYIEDNFPHTSLTASGISVGLPWGEVGNSEVGHLTIGAGKTLYQHYPRITMAIKNGLFFSNKALKDAFSKAKEKNKTVNFVGLLSKGNVHSSLEHLLALTKMAAEEGVAFKMHLFADGKDSAPHSIENYITYIPQNNLSTLIGRYYAMDREENWSLTEQTYNCLTGTFGKQIELSQIKDHLKSFFTINKSEEFLPPLRFGGQEKSIENGDSIIFFNFREDSVRQLTSCFLEEGFDKFKVKDLKDCFVVTMTPYSDKFKTPVAFPPDKVENCLGKVISDAGKNQLRIAETYKYAHITYFFNGYKEEPFPGEYRVVIPSENIPHPDQHPAMMAGPITDRVVSVINENSFDFVLVNYANPDTIAHTGNYKAAEEVVKIIDESLGKLIKAAEANDGYLLITSDHGNIEQMVNPLTGRIETQHDPSPVPFYLMHSSFKGRKFSNQSNLNEPIGILSDIAPTILEILGVSKPAEMTGESLLKRLI